MAEINRELSLYDVADWIWRYRVLAVLLLATALVATVLLLLAPGNDRRSYTATFQIYSAGTPVRSAAEISDILASKFRVDSDAVLAGPGSLTVTFATREAAEGALTTARDVQDSLVAEVTTRLSDVESLIAENEVALSIALQAKSFLGATKADLITLIHGSVRENVIAQPRSILAAPAVFFAFVFFGVASLHSFWRGWRRRRILTVDDSSERA